MGRFAAEHQPAAVGDYDQLWRWSVEDLPGFWGAVWEHFSLGTSIPMDAVLGDSSMPGAQWFEGARVNYARQALRGNGLAADDVAVFAESQTRDPVRLTLADLREEVRRVAAGLRRLGVTEGDRVAGYLPNVPEAVVGLLATASLGAVWSSCAPEFGTRSVIDRWSQIDPKVLLAVDGYRYGPKEIDRSSEVRTIMDSIGSIQHTVVLPYLHGEGAVPGAMSWESLAVPTDEPLAFTDVPFDHPLYVLYSSGTSGLPKPIVHGHGGIIVEHVKSLGLHLDLGPGDRFFWFSTTGWMMWNYLVSGLLVGAAVVLFDGDPSAPDLDVLWSLVDRSDTTYAGMSAPYLMACRTAGLRPGEMHDLARLRGIGSTGAPLPPAGYRWVYDAVGGDLQLGSMSGGTDVCTAFVGPAPVLPVHVGVISGRALGCRVESYDAQGRALVGEQGELVVTAPMPSMPVAFWGDQDDERYRSSYFETYPGVWRHGDWITVHADGSCVLTGRSDATLNRGGVRLGTAEFYGVVEELSGVADSLVVHLADDVGGMGELILFVVPSAGRILDDELRSSITRALRRDLSPRHIPDAIVPVPTVPRTLSGKKLEIPIKNILGGASVTDAVAAGAVKEPEALEPYVTWARARGPL